MSLKEKFDKAGLTGTTVALPKGKIKDGSGAEKDYKTSKETKKLVKESQTKDAKVIKTPGALVKGASFSNQAEKKKTRANTAADKVSGFAGSFIASANANTLGTNAKNVSVLADAMARSRETAAGVKTPIAATKGSVFVNKGYDPQNAERSLRETQNLKSVSGRANAFAQAMAAKERSIDAEAKKNLDTVGGVAYDLGKVGTQLATDAVANILAPGAGLASMGARSFGQGMMTAEEQGKTGARAIAYAAGTAAIEAGTEKISAAAKPLKAIYGAGLVDDAMQKLTEKLIGTSKGRQILSEIGRSAAGEAAEEALADVLQVPLQNIALQNGAKFDAEWVADTAYDALLGGIMGGVLGTAGNIGAMAHGRTEAKGNAKADVIANAMTQAAQKNAQKNAPPVFQTAQKQTEQPVQQEAPQAGTVEQTPQAGTHIDQRTAQGVGDRNVKAFQYEHPEVRPFYQTAAEDLLADADLSTQMPAGSRKERTMQGNRHVHTTQASAPLRYAMDMGLTRQNIMDGAEDIIKDEGAENNANAKRVELVLDKMLKDGYSTMFGKTADPNAEYIKAKQGIPGYQEQAQGEELPIWDMTADEQQRSREVLRDNEEATQNDGLGAADRGSLNTAYENLQEQSDKFYPEGANAARPVDVPMFDANGNPISKSASTVMGAKAIPDDAVPLIEQMIADGQLSYQTVKDKESIARAQAKVTEKGFDGAMEEFRSAVNDGKVNKDMMTLGQTLLNSAANNNDGHAVAEILTLYRALNTSAAQALQAASIFRKLDPESQLYGIRRVVDHLNDALAKKNRKASAGNYTQEVVDAMQEQYDIAKRLLADIAKVMKRGEHTDLESVIEKYPQYKDFAKYFREIDSYILGEKQSGWVETLGRELAVKAGQRARDDVAKERTVYETILSDLNAFMNEHVDNNKPANKPRTATERIRDFFHNRDEYARAWAVAKKQLRIKYKGNQLMLKRLDDFLNGEIIYTYGTVDTVMMKAVAESAIADGIKAKEFTVRRDFDRDAMANQIADHLIRETGAEDADAVVIRDAAKQYIAEKLPKENQTASDILNRSIKSSMRHFGIRLSEILTQSAKSKEEIAKRISDSLISEYHISPDGAAIISDEIAGKFADMVQSASRKKLDSMFKDRPKREQKDAMKRFEELANLGAFFGNYNPKATEKVFGYAVQIDPALVQKFTEQTDQAGRDAVMLEIYQNIADQVPSTWKEKWDSWRYTAMLFNPRTHIRNIAGNLFFQPIRMIKNGIAAGMESGLSAAGVNIERTKSFGASPELYRACWNDFENVKDVLGGSKYNEIETEIEKNRRIFKTALLETIRRKNKAFLEAEDAVFKRITYTDSLTGYLHAHGVTAEQLNSGTADSGVLTAGRNYAAKEAQKATYQDRNAFSDKVADVVNSFGVVGDAVMPFKRTPANILARGVEYSPIGAAKALTYDLYKVKQGEKTAAEAIDDAAAGLTGSGLLALGALLLMKGIVTGSQGDDKDDLWAQLLGHQGYALELPDGTSVTIDWLAPASLPFFMGVEMASSIGENGWSAESVWDALKSVANPMLELSMLQSVNDLIDSVKYAEEAPLAAMIPSAIVSYFSQAIPTVGGQIERTAQDKRMTTYTEKDSKIPTDVQYALGRASAKIPGWDYQQIPYIDAWGQEEKTGTPFMRAFDNFLNPSYVSQVEMDKVEKELQKVRDATGDANVFPGRAEKSITIDGEDKNLTAEQYVKYAKQLGKEKYTLLKDAVNSDVYQSMSAAEKADFISYAYKYARNMTEYDQFQKAPSSEWMLEARQSGDVVGAICDRVLYGGNEKAKQAVETVGITIDQYNAMNGGMDADGNGGVSQDEAKAYLDSQNFSRDQKAQLWNIISKSWKNNPYK